MLSVPGSVKIFFCLTPTDMRKSIDGLAGLANSVLAQDPLIETVSWIEQQTHRDAAIHADRYGAEVRGWRAPGWTPSPGPFLRPDSALLRCQWRSARE